MRIENLPEIGLRLLAYDMYHNYRWSDLTTLASPHWRFYWNATLSGHLLWQGEQINLGPDEVILLPPDTDCVPVSPEPMAHMFFHFLAEPPYDAVVKDVYRFPVREVDRRMFEGWIDRMDREAELTPQFSMQILGVLYQYLSLIPENCLGTWCADTRIQKVLQAITQRLDYPIINDELAKLCGMNTNAFIRLFGQLIGETPRSYLMRKRIERACILLHFSEQTIDTIAADCGFCDRHYFSRVFKEHRGVGPAEFRRSIPDFSPRVAGQA